MTEDFENGRYSTPSEDRALLTLIGFPAGSFVIGGICGLLDGQGVEMNQDVRNGMLYAPSFLCAAFIPSVYIASRRAELEEMAKEHPDNPVNQSLLEEFKETSYEIHQLKLAAIGGVFGAGSTIFGYACGRAASCLFRLF